MIQNSNNLKLTHYPSYKSRSNKIVIPNPFHHQSQTSKLFFKNTTKFPKTTKLINKLNQKRAILQRVLPIEEKAIHPNIKLFIQTYVWSQFSLSLYKTPIYIKVREWTDLRANF